MCTIVKTYTEYQCGASVFSGRSQTDCGQSTCATSHRHAAVHPGQPCTTACKQCNKEVSNTVKANKPCPNGC